MKAYAEGGLPFGGRVDDEGKARLFLDAFGELPDSARNPTFSGLACALGLYLG